jgi:hypothetical protein
MLEDLREKSSDAPETTDFRSWTAGGAPFTK